MSRLRVKSSLLIGSLAALSACGGGSGGTTTVTAKYPLDLAVSTFWQMPHTFHLKATNGSDNYTLDTTITPGRQASFQGVQAMTDKTVSTETKNGAAIQSGTSTDYFLTTPYTQLGTVLGTGLTIIDGDQKP